MSTKFNAKRFPIEDTQRPMYFVDDLARIEAAGPTLRLLFALVHSDHYGEGWRQHRQVIVELAIPIELREQIAREILNFKGVPESEAQTDVGDHTAVLLH